MDATGKKVHTHTHTGKIKANFIRPGPLINKGKKKKAKSYIVKSWKSHKK